jgi:hypothetical protein
LERPAPTSNPRVNAGKTGGFFNRQSPNTGKLPRFLAATAVGDSTSRSGPHKICCAGNKPAVQGFRLGRLRQTLPLAARPTPIRLKETDMKKLILSAVLSAVAASPLAAQEWGTVTGQVIVSGNIPTAELLHRKGAEIKDKEVVRLTTPTRTILLSMPTTRALHTSLSTSPKHPKPSTLI